MSRRIPSHLRLHTGDQAPIAPSSSAGHANRRHDANEHHSTDPVVDLLKAFSKATGWAVRSNARKSYSSSAAYASSKDFGRDTKPASGSTTSNLVDGNQPTQPNPISRWRLVDGSPVDGVLSADDLAHFPTVTLEDAEVLLTAVEKLVEQLEQAEATVRRQEAELATSVSVTRGADEQEELADRIESVLESASRSIGAQASAAYLLDEGTSSLKMRASYGLPSSRLLDPPRDLRGSLGDLEALLGNAVLLEDMSLVPDWKSPEPYDSALVVPIGTASMPHGTIWFWSETPKKYSASEIEIANLAAGRLMSELEQSILGVEVKKAKRLRRQIDAAGYAQAARWPDRQPLHSDFQIDGWTFQTGGLGGGFHDWDLNPNSMIVGLVGSAFRTGAEGALVATACQSAVRSQWPFNKSPSQILQVTGDLLWGTEEVDWSASALLLQLNPESGYGTLANAGDVQAFIVSQRGFRPLGIPTPRLASHPDIQFPLQRFVLQPNEVMLAFSDTVIQKIQGVDPTNSKSRRKIIRYLDQNEMLQSVRSMVDATASEIANHLARMLPSYIEEDESSMDRSLFVIKNIRKNLLAPSTSNRKIEL